MIYIMIQDPNSAKLSSYFCATSRSENFVGYLYDLFSILHVFSLGWLNEWIEVFKKNQGCCDDDGSAISSIWV